MTTFAFLLDFIQNKIRRKKTIVSIEYIFEDLMYENMDPRNQMRFIVKCLPNK